jgi:hypothetical protein
LDVPRKQNAKGRGNRANQWTAALRTQMPLKLRALALERQASQ